MLLYPLMTVMRYILDTDYLIVENPSEFMCLPLVRIVNSRSNCESNPVEFDRLVLTVVISCSFLPVYSSALVYFGSWH